MHGARVEDLIDTWGVKLLNDFDKQNTNGKVLNNAPAVDENDSIHTKMMEFEPMLEESGERNLRSINLTRGGRPCHCVAQTIQGRAISA